MKSIEEQTKLMDLWFDGKYFLHLATEEQNKMFIKFISFYDNRYYDFDGLLSEYVAWRYCESLHHSQLQQALQENYWSGKMLEYGTVKDYIEHQVNAFAFMRNR